MRGARAGLMASWNRIRARLQQLDDDAYRVRAGSLPGSQAAIAAATFVLSLAWIGLQATAWITQPAAIGTFMFQFLHVTAFTLVLSDIPVEVRAGATLFFLATDAVALILRCTAPVIAPAWGLFHVLAVVHSALVLALGLLQTAVFWAPYAFVRPRPAVA